MSSSKTITLAQLKDALRYVFADVYGKVDLTDYDNWVGFTHFIEDVWKNLDKRIARKKKAEFGQKPAEYVKFVKLPFIGILYRLSSDSSPQ